MLYTVIIKGYKDEHSKRANHIGVDTFVLRFTDQRVSYPSSHCPYVVVRGVSEKVAYSLADYLRNYGCIVDVNKSQATVASKYEKALSDFFMNPGDVRCPICGSTSISTGSRGYSIVTGFFGSNKTVNRCARCGNTWQPKI